MPSFRAASALATVLLASLTSAIPFPQGFGPPGAPPGSVPTGPPTPLVETAPATTWVTTAAATSLPTSTAYVPTTSEYTSNAPIPVGTPLSAVTSIPAETSAPSGTSIPAETSVSVATSFPTSASVASVPASSVSSAASTQTPLTPNNFSSSTGYWLADIDHSNDFVWQGAQGYTVFRNVMDYGATGDGSTDDTDAINQAMSSGNRCGGGPGLCDSSTITPAIVYFPAGTYVVSSPILMYYYTQMIGDPNNLPTIVAAEDFTGMAMIDSDPYGDGGENWFTNQNNFFRQVRNFIVDVSPWGNGAAGAGIHWQVAQATSLQNMEFRMSNASGTQQQGIFMDNGSGGFFSDLTFSGGKYGAFLGSQQFTSRNLVFYGCETAIYMNWNWGWLLQGITVNGGTTAVDMSNSPTNQTVGSVVLADSVFTGIQYGVRTAYQDSASNTPPTAGTLIIDNVDMTGVSSGAVVNTNNETILAPGMVTSWAAGKGYSNSAQSSQQQGVISPPIKASSLLDSNGNIFTRDKPQYETLPVTSFLSAMSSGLKGDGATDDTAAMQSFLNQASEAGQVAYFEHGAYLISNTIHIPSNIQIVGEIWPLIVADGSAAAFNDQNTPQPVWSIGEAGQMGAVEISDMIFETLGPAPGAIMIEWNLESSQGGSGLWDSHVRIGGSAGTNLEYTQCAKNPESTSAPDSSCLGVFMMFHATKSAGGVYLENTWFWVADHALDADAPKQISIYSGRGVLIEAAGPVWLWGTASEHSILYNYNWSGVKALFAGFIQSETPYFQPNPKAPQPFTINAKYADPPFRLCSHSNSEYCQEAWGLHIRDSTNVLVYAAGLYSFFQNYDQSCVTQGNCQDNMVHIRDSQVGLYALTTIGAVNMVIDSQVGTIQAEGNRNVFGDLIGWFTTDGGSASTTSSGTGGSAGNGAGQASFATSSGSGRGRGGSARGRGLGRGRGRGRHSKGS